MSATGGGGGQLLVPALAAGPDGRFTEAREAAHAALALGVGGFVLRGGEQEAVRAFTKDVRQRSRTPLLVGAEMERGAGQQFAGATGLPPLAALAWLGDAEALRRAARLTAREARTMGVTWNLAPVVDLDVGDDAPTSGTRSLGSDAAVVARMAAEWITACQAEGVLACAKHFPGHGRAPHGATASVPTVAVDRDTLHATDLAPFRAAIDAGVASMMTAHAIYPTLDPSGLPASQSRELLTWVLRQQLRYDNLVVASAPAMRRAGDDASADAEAAVRAITAGCDVIVAPSDPAAVAAAIDRAVAERRLDPERVRQAVRRRMKWAQWASPPNDWRRPTASDAAWGAQLADRVVHVVRGTPPSLASVIEVLAVDAAGEHSAGVDGAAFLHTLRTAGVDARVIDHVAPSSAPLVLALFPGVEADHGRADAIDRATSQLSTLVADARAHGREPLVVLFAHPRLAVVAPPGVPVLCAWTADAAMQRAAARWLTAPAR